MVGQDNIGYSIAWNIAWCDPLLTLQYPGVSSVHLSSLHFVVGISCRHTLFYIVSNQIKIYSIHTHNADIHILTKHIFSNKSAIEFGTFG